MHGRRVTGRKAVRHVRVLSRACLLKRTARTAQRLGHMAQVSPWLPRRVRLPGVTLGASWRPSYSSARLLPSLAGAASGASFGSGSALVLRSSIARSDQAPAPAGAACEAFASSAWSSCHSYGSMLCIVLFSFVPLCLFLANSSCISLEIPEMSNHARRVGVRHVSQTKLHNMGNTESACARCFPAAPSLLYYWFKTRYTRTYIDILLYTPRDADGRSLWHATWVSGRSTRARCAPLAERSRPGTLGS